MGISSTIYLERVRAQHTQLPCCSAAQPQYTTTLPLLHELLEESVLAVLLLQFQLFCLWLWNPDLFTGCATCPRPAVFNSLETAGVVEILSMIGYEKPTDIYF
jgi:hypothetical protein